MPLLGPIETARAQYIRSQKMILRSPISGAFSDKRVRVRVKTTLTLSMALYLRYLQH